MNCGMNFAWANRQMITFHARIVFQKVLHMTEHQLEMNVIYDVSHNTAKIEPHFAFENNDNENLKILQKANNFKGLSNKTIKNVLVHRKGATRAFPSGMGCNY